MKKMLIFFMALFIFPVMANANFDYNPKKSHVMILDQTTIETTNNFNQTGDYDCQGYLGDPSVTGTTAYYLQQVFNIMKYVAIILVLVFTIIDFFKALVSQDHKELQKAAGKAALRLVIAIIIFFLPTITEFILKFLHVYGDYDLCGIR